MKAARHPFPNSISAGIRNEDKSNFRPSERLRGLEEPNASRQVERLAPSPPPALPGFILNTNQTVG